MTDRLRSSLVVAAVMVLALAVRGGGRDALGQRQEGGRQVTLTVFISARAETSYGYSWTGPFDRDNIGTVHSSGQMRDSVYAEGWGETRYRIEMVDRERPEIAVLEVIREQGGGRLVGGGSERSGYVYTSNLGGGTSRKDVRSWWSYKGKPVEGKWRGPDLAVRGGGSDVDVFVDPPGGFPSAAASRGLMVRTESHPGGGDGREEREDPIGPGLRVLDVGIGKALYGTEGKEFRQKLMVKLDWNKPVSATNTARYSWKRTTSQKSSYGWGNDEPQYDVVESVTVEVTWTLSEKPPMSAEMEMIPQEGYDQWEPIAGADEKTRGNSFLVKLDIHKFNQPGVAPDTRIRKLTVQLANTSREKGVCMNVPAREKATDDYDFRIRAVEGLSVDQDGQTATATGKDVPAQWTIVLDSFDFAAFTELTAKAELENGQLLTARLKGRPDRSRLVVPQDENDNRVADGWEKEMGVYEKNYPPDWDGARVTGQRRDGDGITLFQKYRGFRSTLGHLRLVPERKYIFIFDPADYALQSGGLDLFARASGVVPVVLARQEQWTGRGSSRGQKRIVNFNHGYAHKTDQHVLDFVVDQATREQAPPGWAALQERMSIPSAPMEEHVFGRTFPDGVADMAVRSPADAYQVTVYPNTIKGDVWLLGEVCMQKTGQTDPTQALKKFHEAHPDQYPRSIAWQTRVTVAHEIAHGVGAPHHAGETDGNRLCVMRYLNERDKSWDSADPFWVRRYDPPPFLLCDKSLTSKGIGCKSTIQITDGSGP
jgi:hypothetical protein